MNDAPGLQLQHAAAFPRAAPVGRERPLSSVCMLLPTLFTFCNPHEASIRWPGLPTAPSVGFYHSQHSCALPIKPQAHFTWGSKFRAWWDAGLDSCVLKPCRGTSRSSACWPGKDGNLAFMRGHATAIPAAMAAAKTKAVTPYSKVHAAKPHAATHAAGRKASVACACNSTMSAKAPANQVSYRCQVCHAISGLICKTTPKMLEKQHYNIACM